MLWRILGCFLHAAPSFLVLWILATLIFTQFLLLMPRVCWAPAGTTRLPLPSMEAWNTLKTASWDNHRNHYINLLSLKDHCPLLPYIQCLANLFCVFFFFFYYLWWDSKFSPCYSILAESPNFFINILDILPSPGILWTNCIDSKYHKNIFFFSHCCFIHRN